MCTRKSIASVIEKKASLQAEVRLAELELRRKELELEERKLQLQEEKDAALITLLTTLANKSK